MYKSRNCAISCRAVANRQISCLLHIRTKLRTHTRTRFTEIDGENDFKRMRTNENKIEIMDKNMGANAKKKQTQTADKPNRVCSSGTSRNSFTTLFLRCLPFCCFVRIVFLFASLFALSTIQNIQMKRAVYFIAISVFFSFYRFFSRFSAALSVREFSEFCIKTALHNVLIRIRALQANAHTHAGNRQQHSHDHQFISAYFDAFYDDFMPANRILYFV